MSTFHPKEFLIQPKKSLITFVIFYIFLMIILAAITRSASIKFCSSCRPDYIATVLFYTLSLGLTYFLFCWMNYMWKKALKGAK